jgi:UDPglucose 6-dehydrogenase
VSAVDLEGEYAGGLASGRAPVYEPGLDDLLGKALAGGTLGVGTDPAALAGCAVVFLAYDTPVRDDDTSDLDLLERAVERIAPHLTTDAVLVVSAQLPLGTAALFRRRLKRLRPEVEIVYSPENLRLGEAIACYLRPGHVVIGADDPTAGDRIAALFGPMDAKILRMSLASAEMTKHGINAWLATSITFTNQLADLCSAGGADVRDVVAAMRCDPRIGARAYLAPGLGFSGGTLGRDLRVLDALDERAGGTAPLFGDIWRYNSERRRLVTRTLDRELPGLKDRRVALWGLTYKPGTSTLRRSLPLQVAADLLDEGVIVAAFDPKADWDSAPIPAGLERAASASEAARGADAVVLLTEWPELIEADLAALKRLMRGALLVDTKNAWAGRDDVARLGFRYRGVGVGGGQDR